MSKKVKDNVKNDIKVSIPKIIMQTWKTKDVPEHWSTSPKGIAKYMPSWKYILMTDEDNRNFIEKHFPDFLPYYDNFEYGIQRADAIRYAFLYVNGGLYMDLDIQVIKPLDELFTEDKELFLVKSGNFAGFYTNAFMASKPKSPIMLACIEEMKKPYAMWNVGKHLKVMNSSGPMMMTRVVKKFVKPAFTEMLGLKQPTFSKEERSKMVHDLPTEFLMSCSVCDPKPCDIREGYVRILQGSSWCSDDTKFYVWCTCNAKPIAGTIFVLILVLIIIIFAVRESRKS